MRIHYNLTLDEIRYACIHLNDVALKDRAMLLHMAIAWELVDEVKMLLGKNVNIYQKVKGWTTAKDYAIHKAEIVKNSEKREEILSLINLQEEKLNLEKLLAQPNISKSKIKL